MKNRFTRSHMGNVFALLLLCVFAVGILSVLVTGAGVYRRLVERDEASYEKRTAERYVSVKVQKATDPESISIEDFGGVSALAFTEEIDGVAYWTRIYCYEGYLRELFCAVESDLTPADGEKILPMKAFFGEKTGNLLRLRLFDVRGGEAELMLALRRTGEGES